MTARLSSLVLLAALLIVPATREARKTRRNLLCPKMFCGPDRAGSH